VSDTTLHRAILHRATLPRAALHRATLHRAALHCATLHSATGNFDKKFKNQFLNLKLECKLRLEYRVPGVFTRIRV